jgi:hypothetical protein
MHYSKYKDGTKLNKLLFDNLRIFKDTRKSGLFYRGFVPNIEASFKQKFEFHNRKLPKGSSNLNFQDEKEIPTYLEALGLVDEDFSLADERGKRDYTSLTKKDGSLNPMIRKWLWLNSLYRNEYLFISAKGEYMHPHKNTSGTRTKVTDKNFWEDYNLEASGRLSSMSKRNVLYTATIEAPIRDSKLGVPDEVNMAVIRDKKDNLYNISGLVKSQEVHDGSSYIDYVYHLMINASYPSKGYGETKKQFASLITKNGVTIKKDAESVITNDKIINSKDSAISLFNKKKQMLGIPVGILDMNLTLEFNSEFFFIKNNTQYSIDKVMISNNNYELSLSKKVGDA